MLESFKVDLSYLQQNPPEGKKARTKELEEHRVRTEYLQYEVGEVLYVKVCLCKCKKADNWLCVQTLQISRYEIYIQVLEGWRTVGKTGNDMLSPAELNLFDKIMCADSGEEAEEEEGSLKKSHSSPSLELEAAPPTVIKVRRNISERRTYRRPIIPRWKQEAWKVFTQWYNQFWGLWNAHLYISAASWQVYF